MSGRNESIRNRLYFRRAINIVHIIPRQRRDLKIFLLGLGIYNFQFHVKQMVNIKKKLKNKDNSHRYRCFINDSKRKRLGKDRKRGDTVKVQFF